VLKPGVPPSSIHGGTLLPCRLNEKAA